LSIFSGLQDQVNTAKTLANLGLLFQEDGNLEQARDYFELALSGYQELADKHGEAVILVSLARLHNLLGDTDRALEYSSKAYAISETHSFVDQITRLEKISIDIQQKSG
jgi:tetratricopeptide (TPR) repeat protein